jgi:hypothetical protein
MVYFFAKILAKMGWATFWAIFSPNHLVTLISSLFLQLLVVDPFGRNVFEEVLKGQMIEIQVELSRPIDATACKKSKFALGIWQFNIFLK